jgi:zinc transport system substrate-binding protein
MAVLVGLTGCRRRANPTTRPTPAIKRITVAASIYPIADVLSEVGGARVETLTFLPPDRLCQDYQLNPYQVERLATVRLLVVVGLGLDDWARQAAVSFGQAGPRILDLSNAIASPPTASAKDATPTNRTPAPKATPSSQPDPPATDAYVWLDPLRAIDIAAAIAQSLAELDPPGAPVYAANTSRYQHQLRQLDRYCVERLAPLARRKFVTLYPSFGHFAARYGLKGRAVMSAPAKELTADQVNQITAFIKQHHVRFIFAGPPFPVDCLDDIARRTGAGVDRLDPFGAPDVVGHDSYVELIKTNLATLVEGLSR